MSLRKKTLALVSLAIFAQMTILYLTLRVLLLDSFAHVEEQATRQDVQRALSAISQQVDDLDTTVYDWAAWDDTYDFMGDHDPQYEMSNLLDETFVGLRLNLILLVSPSGQTIFGKAFDTHLEEEVSVPDSVLDNLTETGLLRPGEEISSGVKGLLVLPEGPLLVASRPVLTSEDGGPMRGWFIMGRYLDSEQLQHMERTTHLSLSVHPSADPHLPDDFQEALPAMSQQTPIVVRPLSADSVAGYATVADIYGEPGLTLRVDTPRPIYRQGQSTIAYFIASVLVVVFIFGVLGWYILDRQVLRRVNRLTASVDQIRSQGDFSARVPVTGEDELSGLAREINRMLAAVEHAHADLKESEERFRRMADNIQDGLIILEDRAVVYANERACEIFGYPRDELAAAIEPHLAMPDHKGQSHPVPGVAAQGGPMPETLESWIARKDGTRRFVASRQTSSPDGQGVLHRYVVTTDMTERKLAEDGLRDHSLQLEAMVAERTRELQDMQEELSRMEKLALLGELAGGVSHELRNPLAVISNAVYFLRTLLTDADDVTAEYLEMVSNEVNRAAKIVSDLLDVSRTKPARREETQVSGFVSEALSRKHPPEGVEVKTEIPSDLPCVCVDAQQMGLVVSNLIANAFEAMAQGGALTISAWQGQEGVCLSVADTGQGIPPEHMTKIFEPLFTTKPHGIGLGLSLCKSLVEANEGIIRAESTVGSGTTFTMVLPTRCAET
jgi:PAS domain S-box-containing protein